VLIRPAMISPGFCGFVAWRNGAVLMITRASN
jgi:hypothetical protein